MDENELKILITVIAFVVIIFVRYVIYLVSVDKIKKGKKKKNKEINIIEVRYLNVKNKINKERLYTKGFALLFSTIDSFIICSAFLILELLHWALVFKMMLGLILVMGLIYSLYGILGNFLEKRGYQNELQ